MQIDNNYVRSCIVVIFFTALYGILALNLYFIQIKQAPFFKHLGDKQYNVTIQSYPQRAEFLDRHGTAVAINKDSIAAFVLPKTLTTKDELLDFLKTHFPQAAERLELSDQKSFIFIKRNLSDEELQLINDANISDIHLLKESSRFYPYEALGSIIGITDIDNNGLFGLEQQYNKQLLGTPTTYSLKKDAKLRHFYFSKQTTQEGITPDPITLTIDADLQFKFQTILNNAVANSEAVEGAAVALDPDTGEILTMVSCPSFNPNDTKDLDISHTKNRAISECFESGSVMKVFAALAALEEGVVTPDEIIDCEDTKETKLDNIRIRTVLPKGKISFTDVMKFSNNIGITKVSKRIGQELYTYYKILGLGEFTGINLTGEQKGFVNHPSNWSAYSIQSLSYGYELRTNILQLARAFSMIMNNGYLIAPTIVKTDTVQKSGPFISQRTIHDIQTILEETVQTGTARRAQISGYKIIGKTGTSNILINGTYDESKHIYTFVGAVQYYDYKRVITCYIKESKKFAYASLAVAPLFRKLAECILLHDKIFTPNQEFI